MQTFLTLLHSYFYGSIFTTYAILQKLHHYLNQKEATKIAKNNLYKKSLHCFMEPPVVHTKFCLSTVNKISVLRQQLFVHVLLSHGSRCYLPIVNNINCKASLNYFSATLRKSVSGSRDCCCCVTPVESTLQNSVVVSPSIGVEAICNILI